MPALPYIVSSREDFRACLLSCDLNWGAIELTMTL